MSERVRARGSWVGINLAVTTHNIFAAGVKGRITAYMHSCPANGDAIAFREIGNDGKRIWYDIGAIVAAGGPLNSGLSGIDLRFNNGLAIQVTSGATQDLAFTWEVFEGDAKYLTESV